MTPATVPVCASVGDCESAAGEVLPLGVSLAQALARPKSRTLTLPSGGSTLMAVAPERRVGAAVDLAHAARADGGGDAVVGKRLADHRACLLLGKDLCR